MIQRIARRSRSPSVFTISQVAPSNAYAPASPTDAMAFAADVRHARLLAWVADANPHKQGKFLPGSRIPIVAPERIAKSTRSPENEAMEIEGSPLTMSRADLRRHSGNAKPVSNVERLRLR